MKPFKVIKPYNKPSAVETYRVLAIGATSEELQLYSTYLAHESNHAYNLDSAFSFASAEKTLKEKNVDAILLDINDEEMGGLALFFRLRALTPDTPIVVVVDFNQHALALEAIKNGAQDFIEKGNLSRVSIRRSLRHSVERSRTIKRDIKSLMSELEKAQGQIRNFANEDALTGILNRQGLQQILSSEIRLVEKGWSDLLVLLIDLDDFKRINTTWGHAAGDIILKEVTTHLAGTLSKSQFVGRIGGNQFLVLAPETTEESGKRLAESVRLSISNSPISISSGVAIKMTASIGALVVTEPIASIDEILAKVYVSLQKSKNLGKNRVYFESANPVPGNVERYTLSNILDALRGGNSFHVVKQAIFKLENKDVVGYEFLSRSSIDVFEMPEDFFRVCQEDNMLTSVDHVCLKNCIKAGIALPSTMQRHLNLFPSTIIDIPVEHLLEAFPKEALESKSFCIEISEQQIIGDPSYLSRAVQRFKDAGIQIAIDDVGFGRSCLENLILLEPHIIKIDKRWIQGIDGDAERIHSLIRLLRVADALGAQVVAEGIEREEELTELKGLGVEYGQGFLLGKPC